MSNNKPELNIVRELDSYVSDMKGLLDNMLGVIFDHSGDFILDAIRKNPNAKKSIGLFLEAAKELRKYFPEENEELIDPTNNIDEKCEKARKEGVYELYNYILNKKPRSNKFIEVDMPEIDEDDIIPILNNLTQGLRLFYSPDFSYRDGSKNILLHRLFKELEPGFDKILEDIICINEILDSNHNINLEGLPSKNEITKRNFYSFTK